MAIRSRTSRTLIALVALLAAGVVSAEPLRFHERSSEGWFFYEPEPPAVEPIVPTEEPTPPPSPPAAETNTPQQPAAETGPAPLSVEWLRKEIPIALDVAIDNPSEENIERYRMLQRVMIDKASNFEGAFTRHAMFTPELDEGRRRPLNTAGGSLRTQEANASRKSVVAEIGKTSGIWFFYASTCSYCHQQAPLLRAFAERNGFTLIPISLDGLPLPGLDDYPFKVDSGQAAQLGVEKTPTLFLVRPPSDVVYLSEGFVSLQELEQRVVAIADEYKWISPETYQSTLLVENDQLPTHDLTAIATQLQDSPSQDLVKLLRDKLRGNSKIPGGL